MLLCCLWTALPLVVLGQTYYINFVFNNYRYGSQFERNAGTESTEPQSKEDKSHRLVEQETLEINSKEICPEDEPPDSEARRLDHVHPNTDETFEIGGGNYCKNTTKSFVANDLQPSQQIYRSIRPQVRRKATIRPQVLQLPPRSQKPLGLQGREVLLRSQVPRGTWQT